MNKKTKPQISAAMTAAGRLTAYWLLLDQKVIELGGQPEDLYLLGDGRDVDITVLIRTTAEKLVERGRASRASSAKMQAPFAPSLMFMPVLLQRSLFVIHKNGADVPALLSRMDGAYFVTECVKDMMSQPQFIIGPRETAVIGIFNCEQLGVVGWPETDFFGPKGWEYIKKFGLTKCLPDDGPHIRLLYPNQEQGECFRVGHDPITFGGCSRVLGIGRVGGGGCCLRDWCLDSGRKLNFDNLVALRSDRTLVSA